MREGEGPDWRRREGNEGRRWVSARDSGEEGKEEKAGAREGEEGRWERRRMKTHWSRA